MRLPTPSLLDLHEQINRDFSWWKRPLICWLQWEKWKRARAMSTSYVTVLHEGDYALADTLRVWQDKLWRELYYDGEDL